MKTKNNIIYLNFIIFQKLLKISIFVIQKNYDYKQNKEKNRIIALKKCG